MQVARDAKFLKGLTVWLSGRADKKHKHTKLQLQEMLWDYDAWGAYSRDFVKSRKSTRLP